MSLDNPKLGAYYEACRDGRLEAVKKALEDPFVMAHCACEELVALRQAIGSGHDAIALYLMKIPLIKARLGDYDNMLTLLAIRNHRVEVYRSLMATQAVRQNNPSPLMNEAIDQDDYTAFSLIIYLWKYDNKVDMLIKAIRKRALQIIQRAFEEEHQNLIQALVSVVPLPPEVHALVTSLPGLQGEITSAAVTAAAAATATAAAARRATTVATYEPREAELSRLLHEKEDVEGCFVCLEDTSTTLQCNHYVCRSCLKEMLVNRHRTCGLCRRSID